MSLLNEIRKIAENPAAADVRDISNRGFEQLAEIAYWFNSPLMLFSGLPPWLYGPLRGLEFVAVDKFFSQGRAPKAYAKGARSADAIAKALPLIDSRAVRRRLSQEGDANA